MSENDPIERLRLFPGSTAEQVIALVDLWKQRSKRTFVAMRERMNELPDTEIALEPAAFDNYFRRANRARTPEAVVWALIRVMRDDTWLPTAQQSTLAEALYLAMLKNVSVVTYARIYTLFPGQEQEFKQLCPLGEIVAAQVSIPPPLPVTDQPNPKQEAALEIQDRRLAPETGISQTALPESRAVRQPVKRVARYVLATLLVLIVLWTLLASVGFASP